MTNEERDYANDSVDRMLGQGSANVYQAANKQSVDSNKMMVLILLIKFKHL